MQSAILPVNQPDILPLAMEYHRAGHLDAADQLYGQLTADLPKLAQIVHLRGLVAHSKGDHELTIQFAAQASALDPTNIEAHNLLGTGLFRAGRNDEAVAAFKRGLTIAPQSVMLLTNLSLAYQAAGRFHESLQAAQQAIDLAPQSNQLYGNLGIAQVRLGQHRAAIASFRQTLATENPQPLMWLNLGHAYKEIGDFEHAAHAYRQYLAKVPNDGHAILGLALIRRHTREDLPWCQQLEQTLASGQVSHADRYSIHFALGKIYEDIGHFAVAFSHYHAGHQIGRQPLNRAYVNDRLQTARTVFTPHWFRNRQGYGLDSAEPIFIVGMFRSGSTLVEHILASHSQVYGGGELPDIERLYFDLPHITGAQTSAQCFNSLGAVQVQGLANEYLNRRLSHLGDKTRFTDKMLVNFWNLGLIALMFPRAKIIHCHRDPLDTCISAYCTRFTDRPEYVDDLEDLGFYYRQYLAVMDHWRHVLPLPIFDLGYEQMVADQYGTTRRLLEFCGLPWEPQCLEFHETDRPVSTSSDWQVRQPIFNSSIGRWQRFAPYLSPLFESLGIRMQ